MSEAPTNLSKYKEINMENISILTEGRRDLNPEQTKRYQLEAHLAILAGNDADIWVGDGWLIPTRSSSEHPTYTYIPAN